MTVTNRLVLVPKDGHRAQKAGATDQLLPHPHLAEVGGGRDARHGSVFLWFVLEHLVQIYVYEPDAIAAANRT